jgi:ribosomal protein S18 acetylase RimI-like enzyme
MSRSALQLSLPGAPRPKGDECIDRPEAFVYSAGTFYVPARPAGGSKGPAERTKAFGLTPAQAKRMDLPTVLETPLTYRLALPSDRWALAWIEARSFGWGRLLGGQWLALDGRRTCGWLACDPAGRARGYALVQRRANRPYVPGIGVLPDWRRRGIGEQLMRLVLGAHRDVWLHAREGNTSARRMYARLGLRETRRVAQFYADGEAAIVIEAAQALASAHPRTTAGSGNRMDPCSSRADGMAKVGGRAPAGMPSCDPTWA